MPIYLQHGNMIDYVPPTNMTTDDVVFIGGLVGIPQFPMKSGQAGSLSVDGIYQFDKKEGVAVNLGDVVKYCGTTKLAQDSNADLTLGVAVAKAEANDIGVNVKINSVLPTDGGGGGGEVAVSCGLTFNEIGELYVANGCGLNFDDDDKLVVNVAYGCGLDFNEYGQLVATGGGGGGGGLQNLATGYESLSILGRATTSDLSVSVGFDSNASGRVSTALGVGTTASGCGSIAIGGNITARGDYTTALGYGTFAGDAGTTVISAWDNGGNVKTQLYLIGAGSTMSTTYCDGEAGLGFMYKDSSGNITKRGTIKLSALMTENTDTFNPTGEN